MEPRLKAGERRAGFYRNDRTILGTEVTDNAFNWLISRRRIYRTFRTRRFITFILAIHSIIRQFFPRSLQLTVYYSALISLPPMAMSTCPQTSGTFPVRRLSLPGPDGQDHGRKTFLIQY